MTYPKALIESPYLPVAPLDELQPEERQLARHAKSAPRYRLEDLLSEMTDVMPRAEGWEDMPEVGLEVWTYSE